MKMGDGDLVSINTNNCYFLEKISKMSLSTLQGLPLNTKSASRVMKKDFRVEKFILLETLFCIYKIQFLL